MKKDEDFREVWKAIRDELQSLRGQNRFRGNVDHLLLRKEVRIHQENRCGDMKSGQFVVHITSRKEDLWAEQLPAATIHKVSDYEGDWKAWLGAIVDACRGANYLHTNSSKTDYRTKVSLEIPSAFKL